MSKDMKSYNKNMIHHRLDGRSTMGYNGGQRTESVIDFKIS